MEAGWELMRRRGWVGNMEVGVGVGGMGMGGGVKGLEVVMAAALGVFMVVEGHWGLAEKYGRVVGIVVGKH
jgi:hypothetical protein